MQSFALFGSSEEDKSCWAQSAAEAGCTEGRNADADDEEHDRRELEHVLDGVKADEHDTRYAKNNARII